MAQPFTRCPGPTYLSMPWWKDTWDRGMTQSTLGHHLEPCSLEQWTQVMCLKGAKTLSTKHKAQTMAWQIWSRWHNPSTGVQALLISVCNGEIDTWDRGMTQSTLGHHLEPCSLEQWAQVMCPKGAKNTKHNTQPTAWQIWTAKNFTWRNYVRKSRIARLMWLRGASQFLFLGQDGSRWHNPSAGVQALLISVCHGEKDTWDRGMTQSTLGHHLEPCSLEQWTQVMCLKGAKTLSAERKAHTTAWQIYTAKNFTWRNYARKSRIARLMLFLGASQFLFLGQNGSRWHNPSPGVQALFISVCHGERTPETVGWPKAHLDTTSNHAPWNSEPKSCAWRVPKHWHKTQSTYHGMANLHCKKLHLEKLRSEIKNSPVYVAPR